MSDLLVLDDDDIETAADAADAEMIEPTTPTGGLVRSNVGLVLAPFGIALISLLLLWYVTSADKILQDNEALNWNDKILPQLKEHLYLTFWSTVLVILIAVPLGIFLTRPRCLRWSPSRK